MPIDTEAFLDDATKNLVALLDTQKGEWGVKKVTSFQATMKSIYPCIEVNSTGATFEKIESGGGYMADILIDVMFWFQEFKETFAKEELDKKSSQIALFIASHPSLDGYADDVILDGISITALPDQRKIPIVMSLISCRIRKEIFLEYQ